MSTETITVEGHPEQSVPTDAALRYPFDRLRIGLVLRDMYFTKQDPGPGDHVPDFDLPTLEGGRFRSADLADTGPVLMVFGSYTCPVTDSSAHGLKELHRRYGDRVRFVLVNVREAHPGANVTQPRELDEKWEHAVLLQQFHDLRFEVAVDDIGARCIEPWARSLIPPTSWPKMEPSSSGRTGQMTRKRSGKRSTRSPTDGRCAALRAEA